MLPEPVRSVVHPFLDTWFSASAIAAFSVSTGIDWNAISTCLRVALSAKMLTLRLTELQALALMEMVMYSRSEVRAYELTMRGQMLHKVLRVVRELGQGSLFVDRSCRIQRTGA
ncbi:winged helix-turn-helix transcriptional regulator [Novosphingobium sp. fls2-241-R2A-195]|jgi:hypothetical protein|uniref:winged helix-turn-helix transcriptional regulator n=1 Tax=Novosphingobium sp. fls2-241-R2A-195 TaxID=3040296 RepID=UPI00254E6633|nr:winged helix-turn-helix transcriptional regulator [Novosphingobium sp. fls2-241-R2A-195]